MNQEVDVQTQMQSDPQSVRQHLKAERVQEKLLAMPAWGLLPGGEAIARAFQFPSPRVASAFAGFVSAYALEAGHAVRLDIAEQAVVVALAGPRVEGRQEEVNEEILTFAQKLG